MVDTQLCIICASFYFFLRASIVRCTRYHIYFENEYIHIFFFFFWSNFYFPASDKLWSQVSSLLPPSTCLQFLSRIGFTIPTSRRLSSNVANSRLRAFREAVCACVHMVCTSTSTRVRVLVSSIYTRRHFFFFFASPSLVLFAPVTLLLSLIQFLPCCCCCCWCPLCAVVPPATAASMPPAPITCYFLLFLQYVQHFY